MDDPLSIAVMNEIALRFVHLCSSKHKKSSRRESNPPPQLGKLIYYRCTTAASLTFLIISLLFGLVK